MGDKLLTENCRVCGKKIHIDRGFGWVDLGHSEVAEFSKHAECMGLGPFIEQLQDDESISRVKQ